MGVRMSKVLRLKDRIKLKVGKIEFRISPMSYLQKQDLASCTKIVSGQETFDLLKAQSLYIKYSLKEISGVEDYAGEKYELEFENDYLTDDCVSEILNIEESAKLLTASWQVLNGIKELEDPITGKKLTGVKMEVVPGK